ncbi:EF-hand domain-containing protein [Sphingopyxis sp.]|uniref:EF-hand domain-containing protein n=1 Tax=Sphingopyxis sp. TaxID=1908224 RepID=UPI003BAA1C6A
MKKKISLLTLGAALIAVPVLAAPGAGARGDFDGNGTLTRTEAQAHAAEKFAKLDANQDGKLDASDRAAKRAETQAKMFERLDANRDGNISKAEWDQHGADRAAKRDERGEKHADVGGPGEGKRHGMRGHHGKRGGGHDMGEGRMMARADTDGDRAISQAEFQTAALARFDAADGNKDGQVTAEERAAQREAWKAKAAEWRAKRAAAPASE